MRLPLRRVAAALLLAVATVAPPARAEDVKARNVYVRRRTSIPKTVAWVVQEARRLGVGQVLVAFDAASFAPPPGVTEFSAERLYAYDLPAWIDALGNEVSKAPCPIRVTSSLAPKSIRVGDERWDHHARHLIERPWWKGSAIQELEPAVKWINRLLVRTESSIGTVHREHRRMLVLVSGSVTPERWTFLGNRPTWESTWRPKLLPVGRYWNEEGIAALLDADGCAFYAIAPEAHFGDFRPFVELPQLPWASRPQYPPVAYGRSAEPGDEPPLTPGDFDEDGTRRRLDERFRMTIPDPVQRRAAVEQALARMRDAMRRRRTPRTDGPGSGRRPPPPVTPGSAPPPLQHSGWRFDSDTPYWFPKYDGSLFYNNHAPSGYGYWPFARVAAKTGGRYFFYPFPPTRWLDVCPYDPFLLDRLAPELIHKTKYLGRRRGDRAFDALTKAANLVSDDTPWTDSGGHHRAATAWSSFRRVNPLAFHPDWFLRRKPFEVIFEGGDARRALLRSGARIKETVLPLYDKALRILDEAVAEETASGVERSHPRAVADLHLARYWFAMSAFHLDAFATYALELERFVPKRLEGKLDRIWVTYVPTIKMSDCLEAYDDRTLSLDDEAAYDRWVLPDQPGQQGNVLLIDPEHADYRAQRSLASVLKNVDPRLMRRAIDMIQSARRLMGRYALSGWGWTTYYSIAYTFVFLPIPEARGDRGSRPGGSEPPPPTTPRGPAGTPGGGSEPGGPTTGR